MARIRWLFPFILSYPVPLILSLSIGWFITLLYTAAFYLNTVEIGWPIPLVFFASAFLVNLGYKKIVEKLGTKILLPWLIPVVALVLTLVMYSLLLFAPRSSGVEGDVEIEQINLR